LETRKIKVLNVIPENLCSLIKSVDNHFSSLGITQGEKRWRNLLWVKSGFILSLYAAFTHLEHRF